jgi:histidine triad (HIT) family protein
MDINPVTNGHSLIIPKKHYDNIYDIEPDELLHMQKVARILMKEYKEKLGAEGFTLVQNNELGQEVKHYHLHIMPRYQGDQLRTESNQSQIKSVEEVFELLK